MLPHDDGNQRHRLKAARPQYESSSETSFKPMAQAGRRKEAMPPSRLSVMSSNAGWDHLPASAEKRKSPLSVPTADEKSSLTDLSQTFTRELQDDLLSSASSGSPFGSTVGLDLKADQEATADDPERAAPNGPRSTAAAAVPDDDGGSASSPPDCDGPNDELARDEAIAAVFEMPAHLRRRASDETELVRRTAAASSSSNRRASDAMTRTAPRPRPAMHRSASMPSLHRTQIKLWKRGSSKSKRRSSLIGSNGGRGSILSISESSSSSLSRADSAASLQLDQVFREDDDIGSRAALRADHLGSMESIAHVSHLTENVLLGPRRQKSARSFGSFHSSDSSQDDDDDTQWSFGGGGSGSAQSFRMLTRKESLEELNHLRKVTRVQDWLLSVQKTDPRWQIMKFFNDVAEEGADDIERCGVRPELLNPLLRPFKKASVFTVWRPTSTDAIRRMMIGEGTGKGMNIKGKSAKGGILSGFVPFVQIHEERHKHMIGTLPKDGRVCIFYATGEARDAAASKLSVVAKEMASAVAEAKRVLADDESNEELLELAMQRMTWDMANPCITPIDKGPKCYGIEVAVRLFWEGYVMRRDCSRREGSRYYTGRPSEPAFQDMNFATIRKAEEGESRAVVWQFPDSSDPLCPQTLLMAYEEGERVLPVVSDFDCFCVGTRGVKYDKPLPPEQVDLVKWMVSQIETILDSPTKTKSWSSCWLEVLKKSTKEQQAMPRFGFGDRKSYSIMECAIGRLKKTNGAVRHGAECFNYYFPQEIDDKFLVISDTLPGDVPWKYMDQRELQDILCQKIDEGFSFPLNPKWILCDPGWKKVYDKLASSQNSNVKESLDIWFPPDSGLRAKIEDIHKRHPDGFVTEEIARREGTEAMDLAKLELKRYQTLQRARKKLRGVIFWMRLLDDVKRRRIAGESEKPSK